MNRYSGFYLEGQIFPPKINQAYLYASNEGSATLGFEISGKAGIEYDSDKLQIVPSISWPGVSVMAGLYVQYTDLIT